jgi:eukaryotic-like serine/threonine-protein kinase
MTEPDLFTNALQMEDPAKRAAYLAEACGHDTELRARIERLLELHQGAGGFLQQPAVPVDLTVGAPPDEAPLPLAGGNGRRGEQRVAIEKVGNQIGPYKLLQQLGEGGMGTVWVAEQSEPVKRRVALKLIKPGMDSAQVLHRFEAERQALAVMDHTNIAKVLDAGTTAAGRPYFVMELIKGVPITKYCDELHLSLRERLELFVPVCHAIQHAHQKGIIHRDIKPSNVLVAIQDGVPVPKVIDFGVAKATNQQLTEQSMYTEIGQLVGTLEYMSPEQAELSALDIDTRADVYALGVLLYELLTGSTPLDPKRLKQAAFTEIVRIIREAEPPKPSTRLTQSKESLASLSAQRRTQPAVLMKAMRGELDWIVMKCLEKDRTRRYETANGLAQDVARYLNDEPVEACPPSAGYRLRKFTRRYRKPLAVAAGFTALLVVGAVVSVLMAARAISAEGVAVAARNAEANEREHAEQQRDRAIQAENLAGKRLEQATVEKLRADEERAVAEAVNGFLLKDLLGQANVANQPNTVDDDEEEGRTVDIKVRTLLDRAARNIEGKFTKQPLTEAAIRQTLADAYRGLGYYDLAQEHAERAVALRTAKLGSDHRETLESEDRLASLYRLQRKYEQAEQLFLKVLQRRAAQLGPDHGDSLSTKNNLAVLYLNMKKYKQAEPFLQEVLQIRMAKGGREDLHTLTAKNNLAIVCKALKKYDEAETLYLEAVEGSTARRGADHPATLLFKNNLAGLYRTQKKYEQAERLFAEVLKIRTEILGLDHPDTVRSSNELAALYKTLKKYGQAEQLYKDVVQAFTANKGADQADTLKSKIKLAGLYRSEKKYELAEPIYQTVLQARITKLGTNDLDTLESKNDLGDLYRDQGKHDRAESYYLEAANGARTKLGIEHTKTQSYLRDLIECYQKQGKAADAVPLRLELVGFFRQKDGPESTRYASSLTELGKDQLLAKDYAGAERALRESLAIRQKKQPDAWTTFETQSFLGSALVGQMKYADAEPVLLAAYEGMKEREGKIPAGSKARLRDAVDRLVQLYEGSGQAAKAETWRKKREKP